ncbi:MAG: response regulator transcription factor [Spirosomataceae bacterium]
MKLLLIEDEPKTLLALKKGLEECGFDVDTAQDGYSGGKLALKNQYDTIITDILMPIQNGYNFIRNVREAGIITPIIMLTALGTLDDKLEAFDLGADDYLVKPFELKELIARIRVVSKRLSILDGVNIKHQTMSFDDLEINLDTKVVMRNNFPINLTAREFNLLECLIKNQGRVMSKEELLDKVWGMDSDVTENVVESFLKLLRKKIDSDKFSTKLIHTVYGMGYVMKKH